MSRTTEDIDHLSASSIKTYLQCPASWSASYLDELPRRWGSALVKGRAVDAAATANWRQKPTTGEDIAIEMAQEVAEHEFFKSIDEAGGKSEVDWDDSNLGAELDSSMKLTRRHMTDHAPLYTPKAVQQRIELPIINSERVFVGFIDALTDDEVIDVKTGGRRMSQADADRDIQASAYALATGLRKFTFARVIHPSAKAQTSSELVHTERTVRGTLGFQSLVMDVSDAIDAGIYVRQPGYWCSWCPAANTCPVGQPNI